MANMGRQSPITAWMPRPIPFARRGDPLVAPVLAVSLTLRLSCYERELIVVRDIAIIGTGITGVSVLGNVMNSPLSTIDSITLIDTRAPGWGPVYNPGHPLLLCNTSAGLVSLLPQEPDDFLGYLAGHGKPATPEAYVPRDQVGEYVRARYEQYSATAASCGVKMAYQSALVNSVKRRPDGSYLLHLNDGLHQEFDGVVVGTGQGAPKVADGFAPFRDHPRLVPSPYPVSRLRERLAGRDRRVLVVGTGQAAIDAAVVLCGDGHHVTMASRSGVLPAVRERILQPDVAVPSLTRIAGLDPSDPLLHRKLVRILVQAIRAVAPLPMRFQRCTLADPVLRLREEVGLVMAGQCPWQDILVPVIDQLNAWSPSLPMAVRASLLAPYRPLIWRYISGMALPNANRLLRHIDAGQLRLGAYDPAHVAADDSGFDVDIRHGGQQHFDCAVIAVGNNPPTLHVDTDMLYLREPPPSARMLSHLGRDLRVRLEPHAPSERIWMVGETTRIQVPFAYYTPQAVRQAANVASQLSGQSPLMAAAATARTPSITS